MSAQFVVNGHKILCKDGNGDYTVIADIANMRACRQLVRWAQVCEDTESLIDEMIGDTKKQPVKCPTILDPFLRQNNNF